MTPDLKRKIEFLRAHLGKIPRYDQMLNEIIEAYLLGLEAEWGQKNIHRAPEVWAAFQELKSV